MEDAQPRVLDASALEGRSISLKPRLARLDSLLDRGTADDEEAVHDLRGQIVRVRVWLELGGWRVLDDDLRRLRNDAGELRDVELYLERRPPQAIAAALDLVAARARRRLQDALSRRERLRALSGALGALPDLEPALARRRVEAIARRCLRRGHRALARCDEPLVLHAVRRAARRLRYALDWLRRRSRPLVRLVHELGEVGDRIAALRLLRATRLEARAHRRELEAELRHHARRARHRLVRALPTLEALARCSSS